MIMQDKKNNKNKTTLSPMVRKKREEMLKKKLKGRWKTMSQQQKNMLINKRPIPKEGSK
tara:strand:- start:397 stop:573 length:177 start_codon:yes stop_codon:yes gene_type:complete